MRIISGTAKGKKIIMPIDKNTRPLKDMVKQSIFNIIEHSDLLNFNIKECYILDLFSGVGSFGIEAISRGATKVIFFEKHKPAIELLQKNIGSSGVRYQAEMGGANALVIWEDAEIEEAVDAAIASGMACAGQWCTGISKLVIHENIYDHVIDRLVKSIKNIKVGDGCLASTSMGPLNNSDQFNKIQNYVMRAVKQGAEILIGGNPIKINEDAGYFFSPTLLGNINERMEIASEEIFGPIINIFKTSNIESAVKFSNLGKYGLSFSIYTKNEKIAETFIKNIDASLCHINLPTPYREASMPFTGWKKSGIGIPESGRFARDVFTKPKVVYRNEFN